MRELQREDRWTPNYEGTLDELFTEINFTPFKGNGVKPMPAGWISLSTLDVSKYLGDYSTAGWFRVKATEDLARMIAGRSIYGPNLLTLGEQHYLEVTVRNDGRVFIYMRFQSILGSYNLIEVALEELLAKLRAAKEAVYGH